MIRRVEWDESYAVHVAELDAQHRRLFAIFGELATAVELKDTRSGVTDTLDRLFEYADEHFTLEEQELEAVGYPGLREQRMAHGWFLQQVRSLADRHRSGERYLSLELIQMLREWFAHHIKGMDHGYIGVLGRTVADGAAAEMAGASAGVRSGLNPVQRDKS